MGKTFTPLRGAHPGSATASATGQALVRGGAWMTVEQAAAFLSMPVVTLRRSLERHARPTADGGTSTHWNGITARKLGRQWRVWLDAGWLTPTGAP